MNEAHANCPDRESLGAKGAPLGGDFIPRVEGIEPFPTLLPDPALALSTERLSVLQINTGALCNLACKHCHISAGPHRTEVIGRPVLEACLQAIDAYGFRTVDLTGGAPEMAPDFEWFLDELGKRSLEIIVRSNLSILMEPGYGHLFEKFAAYRVNVVASLPGDTASACDAQRGRGTFEAAIAAMRRLNALGYGSGGASDCDAAEAPKPAVVEASEAEAAGAPCSAAVGAPRTDAATVPDSAAPGALRPAVADAPDPAAPGAPVSYGGEAPRPDDGEALGPMPNGRLLLDLAWNPRGAFLPADQESLRRQYARRLKAEHGVTFDRLFALTNNPIGRFGAWLERSGNLGPYLRTLRDAFNPQACEGIMCRSQLSVDWTGRLFDCDFNLAVGLGLREAPYGDSIASFARWAREERTRRGGADPACRRPIAFTQHCYACTAGAGSS